MKASDNQFDPGLLLAEQGSNPATPGSGLWRVFAKADGLYIKDDAGAVTGPFGESGGGGITPVANQFIGSMLPFQVNSIAYDPGANNRAILTPWLCLADASVATAYFRVATQASGHADFGIYDDTLTRLGSTGDFALPAAGIGSQALTGSVSLVAGSLYYFGCAMSTTASDLYGFISPGSAISYGTVAGFYVRKDSAFPLPAGPITPTAYDDVARQAIFSFE